MKVVEPKVTWISGTEDPENTIISAMLQCQESAENIPAKRRARTNEERIATIYGKPPDAPHLGLFEHAYATYRVTGVSRAFSHQLVRHRMASYAQMSQRAVPAEKMGVVVPPDFDEEDRRDYLSLEALSEAVYNKLVKKGRKLEDARFTLLTGVETQLIVTMNYRSWLHFLKLRLDPKAQWEIRFVAEQIHVDLVKIAPNVFDIKYWGRWE